MAKSRRMRWVETVACVEDENAYKILVGNPEGKRPLRRPRHRWKDNIKVDLRET
jgi:carotenoid cleavage dioxygenase-like enzyme